MLKGILPAVYIEHLALLVGAIHILLSDKIADTKLLLAENILKNFKSYMVISTLHLYTYSIVLLIFKGDHNC